MAKLSWLLLAAVAALAVGGLPGGGPAAADAANILVVISMPAPSHLNVFTALTRALAERGHQITLVSPMRKDYKMHPTKNHVIVSVQDDAVDKHKEKSVENFLSGKKKNFIVEMTEFFQWGEQLCRTTLTHPNFKAEVLKPGVKYDLVINEAFFLQESLVALGHKLGAPVIAVNPFGASPFINDIMGNPMNPAYTPNLFLGLPDSMTAPQRWLNLFAATVMKAMYWNIQLRGQQRIVEEFFPDAPHLLELLRSQLALTLVNNHYTLGYPVPLAPGVVEIGGIQITDKPKPLPKDLKEYMDGAKEGVVYFSMGSNLRMEFLPKETMEAIFGALGSVKERVLMKWDGPVPAKGVPKNIKIVDWAPQNDILAHANLRVFVTHGGLLSSQEAIYHAVPLVAIPVFADQEFNTQMAKQKGFAEVVSFKTLTEAELSQALKTVLASPSYKEAAGRLSSLFRAQPQRPADVAVYWVEHVLQYGGAHLRPASVDLHLSQIMFLDLAAVVLVSVLLLALAARALCRCCCGGGRAKSAGEDKKKSK